MGAPLSRAEFSEEVNLAGEKLTKFPMHLVTANLTESLVLSDNTLTNLPLNLLQVMYVDLSKNNYGPELPDSISEALSTYPKLSQLDLSNNNLQKLNNNFTNTKLQTFQLSQNLFDAIPQNLEQNFPNLVQLQLDFNFIKKFETMALKKLKTLSLSLNNIETIDFSTIELLQLTSLDLSRNSITQISPDLSHSCPNLRLLLLSDNFITELPNDENTFPKQLEKLDLHNNKLTSLPNYFESFKSLNELNLEGNDLQEIPSLPSNLVTLYISCNRIANIGNQKLPKLTSFEIESNNLTAITFFNCKSLLYDHNKIENIIMDSTLLKNIIELDLSFNHLHNLPCEFFNNIPNLHSLDLGSNNLSELPENLKNCKNLTELTLSNNPLRVLPQLPVSLEKLLATNCNLESLTEFDSLKRLQICDLSCNQLTDFPLIDSIVLLNLSCNKFSTIPPISSELKLLDLSLNLINNENQDRIEITAPNLVDINLSYNFISKIPKIKFSPNLTYFKISGNPLTDKTLDLSKSIFLRLIDVSMTDLHNVKQPSLVNELMTSNHHLNCNLPLKPHHLYQKVPAEKDWRFSKSGYSELIGFREMMEDSIIVRDDLHLYGVCDGHGGSSTAIFLTENFPSLFHSHLPPYHKNGSSNQTVVQYYNEEKVRTEIQSIYTSVSKKLHQKKYIDGSTLCICYLFKQLLNDNENNQSNENIQSNESTENNQSNASRESIETTTETEPGESNNDDSQDYKIKLVTAHLGDARCLLVKNDGTPVTLTKDHRPENRSEFERIHQMHGKVVEERVDGILGVARSMGDEKVFGVGRDLEINFFDIDLETDKYLILACDGVFDILSNEDVAQIAHTSLNATEAAYRIRNMAFGLGSIDNISVIVVDLKEINL